MRWAERGGGWRAVRCADAMLSRRKQGHADCFIAESEALRSYWTLHALATPRPLPLASRNHTFAPSVPATWTPTAPRTTAGRLGADRVPGQTLFWRCAAAASGRCCSRRRWRGLTRAGGQGSCADATTNRRCADCVVEPQRELLLTRLYSSRSPELLQPQLAHVYDRGSERGKW